MSDEEAERKRKASTEGGSESSTRTPPLVRESGPDSTPEELAAGLGTVLKSSQVASLRAGAPALLDALPALAGRSRFPGSPSLPIAAPKGARRSGRSLMDEARTGSARGRSLFSPHPTSGTSVVASARAPMGRKPATRQQITFSLPRGNGIFCRLSVVASSERGSFLEQ